MAKFKVGDRVRLVRTNTHERWGAVGEEGTILIADDGAQDCRVEFDVAGKWYARWDDLEPVAPATATATATFKVGDRVRFTDKVNDYWWFKPRQTGTVSPTTGGYYAYDVKVDGADKHHPAHVNAEHIELLSAEEQAAQPTPTTPHLPPQVGDAVLIPGVISAINQSPRGTNYNIVFETQNRRMSLHFLEEDFILDDRYCGDCPCANNDNGPAPSADTAKAFDALGDWLRSLAVERAA